MTEKKIKSIINLGDENKLIVQKSKPLLALWHSDLTLAEFKILDTYLARIDSHQPDKRIVIFEKGELEEKLGVKKINNQDLKIRLKHLMGNVIEIPDESIKTGFKLVTLFEEAVAEQDDYGFWTVKLECTKKAMKYFFNTENLGYFRYKLRCVTSLTSRYSYIMFLYLEANSYRQSWVVPLEELKLIVGCDKEETYQAFKHFNNLILKKVQKEILEKTERKYIYETVKKGRTVVAIRFTIKKFPKDLDLIENSLNNQRIDLSVEKELWQQPLEQFEFTQEQYEELLAVLVTIPENNLPQSPACQDSIELMRYHYIDQKTKEILRRDKQKPIRNKFSYLLKILKQDIK